MSDTPQIAIYDVETDTLITRDFTAEELTNFQHIDTESQAQQAEQETKAAARASALAKLADLGLTEEEVAAL